MHVQIDLIKSITSEILNIILMRIENIFLILTLMLTWRMNGNTIQKTQIFNLKILNLSITEKLVVLCLGFYWAFYLLFITFMSIYSCTVQMKYGLESQCLLLWTILILFLFQTLLELNTLKNKFLNTGKMLELLLTLAIKLLMVKKSLINLLV